MTRVRVNQFLAACRQMLLNSIWLRFISKQKTQIDTINRITIIEVGLTWHTYILPVVVGLLFLILFDLTCPNVYQCPTNSENIYDTIENLFLYANFSHFTDDLFDITLQYFQEK